MPKMTLSNGDGTRKKWTASNGLSVLEIAHRHGIDRSLRGLARLLDLPCHRRPTGTGAQDRDEMRRLLDLAFGLTNLALGCRSSCATSSTASPSKLPARRAT